MILLTKWIEGLITNKLPIKAITTVTFWIVFAFSFKNNEEKIITKNGDNLLSIDASLTNKWSTA